MEFKFHLYIQRHYNRTYTVTPLPFFDLTAYGSNLDEIKLEIAEALVKRLSEINPGQLHQYEFNPKLSLSRVTVEVRPVDLKKRNKRREKINLTFALLVEPQEDGQLYVRVPKLGSHGPAFYAYSGDELAATAQQELQSWLDGSSLEQLQQYTFARAETLEALEVEVPVKKLKERDENEGGFFNLFGDSKEEFWALREVGINLSAQAAEGRFRRAYRRDDLIQDIMQTLMAPRNNSVLLVGPSEAGKSVILHEMVRRINKNECPEALRNRAVWMLSPDRIIAGAQFIGTWEERIANIADECRKKGHILFVEDLPGLLEVGRWSKSDSNVGLALRPHLASGELVMIGEGAPDRVAMGDNLGPGFMNLFRRVEVHPMLEEETSAVLSQVARDLEREFHVRVLPEANDAAVQLSRRFFPYRAFPGKAVRLLEESVADAVKDRPRQYEGGSLLRRLASTTLNRFSVISTFSRMSGMPEFIVNDAARLDLSEAEKHFRERIIGQPRAQEAVVNLIATIKAGLNDPHKPLGTFMFIGPTGVGKTQMAKTIAEYLFGSPERLVRFDMSEYRDFDGTAKLIGSFGKDGELTRRVREQPFCVVLLDEFEKADPRIYDVFLQVFGEGRLTDASGKTTSFQNAIIIMTSNLGASARAFSSFGFARGDGAQPSAEVDEALMQHYRQQVEDYFRPEFVNRLDDIVVFGQLDPVALRTIATRELREVLNRDGISRRNLLVEIEEPVIDLVLQTGYSPQFGARPLKREIERLVVHPMARELAQRSWKDDNLLRVSVDRETNRLVLKNIPIEQAAKPTVLTLSSGAELGVTKHIRMDGAQLVEGLALLRRKLAEWLESDTYREMDEEKQRLLLQTQMANFWDDGADARTKMSRFYFLDRLTRRVRQLYERAEYLEDLAVVINRERDARYHAEMVQDYEELYRNASYLDIELTTAHLPHRNQAMLLLRSVGSPRRSKNPADSWTRRMAQMYLHWAEHKGYDRDVFCLLPGRQSPIH
ncbi:MAG: AAA domain-containing protein [Anaerolineae bacterium]|nr:AAA domain-containing protein [Anaerolineae bacterium]